MPERLYSPVPNVQVFRISHLPLEDRTGLLTTKTSCKLSSFSMRNRVRC
jgi:hypothetical protein